MNSKKISNVNIGSMMFNALNDHKALHPLEYSANGGSLTIQMIRMHNASLQHSYLLSY